MTLPSYINPPLREVSLTVSVNGLGLRAVDLGQIWDLFKTDFPSVAEHAPTPNIIESLDRRESAPQVSFQLLDRPPVPRIWMLNDDESELIQIQTDRVSFNWRKIKGDEEYPRYPHIKQQFENAYAKILQYVGNEGLVDKQPVAAIQSEISYINELPVGQVGVHGDPDSVLRVWRPLESPQLGAAEDVRFVSRHIVPTDRRTSGARLLIDLQPATKPETMEPVYVLNLTVRGAPAAGTYTAVLDFMDMGHELIVRTFAGLTTPESQEKWGIVE